jgi:hypothetical protein
VRNSVAYILPLARADRGERARIRYLIGQQCDCRAGSAILAERVAK